MSLETTSSQTIGPYLHIGLTWLVTDDLTGPAIPGDQVTIEGRLTDADGNPIVDASIEFWQANVHGRYAHPEDRQDKPLVPGFKGWGRVLTASDGAFRFRTIKPGRVPGPDGELQAPHLSVVILMRGLLKHLFTRMYFPGEASNDDDPVLSRVPQSRRDTLIASRIGDPQGALEWNIALRGERETVFFSY